MAKQSDSPGVACPPPFVYAAAVVGGSLLDRRLAIIQFGVIAREEQYLRRRFGAEYDAYTRQVRRWI
jgi:protein-S-isoprenylcysteine O-methyltransferase Ste14